MRDKIELLKLKYLYRLPIMSMEDTIEYILDNRCSVARFGDGEFGLMSKTSNIGFQLISDELSEKLLDVLRKETKNKKILICMPSNMNGVDDCSDASRQYWTGWRLEEQKKIVRMIRDNVTVKYMFGDTQVTRPYMGYKDLDRAKRVFEGIKKIWKGQDVLIVEGSKTRLGVGNDLFAGVKSLKRILAPSKNAFGVYDEIVKTIKKYHSNGQMVLLALGPTATVLAADLSHCGIQAIDIGHVDIEYEWFLMGAKKKVPIANKYVNEVPGGDKIGECLDKKYRGEIIAKITG